MTLFQPGGPARFAHQRRGLAKLIAQRGGALLFDPGLGKTAVVLDYSCLLALKAPSGEARVLVVCPLAAVDTWVLQTRTFVSPQVNYWAEALGGNLKQRAEALAARGGGPTTLAPPRSTRTGRSGRGNGRVVHHGRSIAWDARTDGDEQPTTIDQVGLPRLVLIVLNIDSFASRARVSRSVTMADRMVEAVKAFDPDLVVIDESHRIKSPTGNASRALARVGRVVPRRVILTGTVMPHGPLDVFAQWRFLDPTAFGELRPDGTRNPATYGAFKNRYAVMGGYMGWQVTRYRDLDHMQAVMGQQAEVARKADSLDLPPTTDAIVPVTLGPSELLAYQDMKKTLVTQLGGALATAPNRLTQMLRLRQITAGHLPDDQGTVRVIGNSKAATIASLVHDTLVGENRVVIFAVFTAEIAQLRAALTRPGTMVEVIDGSTSNRDRLAIRARFGDLAGHPERIVLLAQIRTMSLAVNELVTASHAVFASLSQRRDDFEQAKARLDRQGQTKPVTFWLAQVPGTVDEVIYRSHQQRTDLESAMLAHLHA